METAVKQSAAWAFKVLILDNGSYNILRNSKEEFRYFSCYFVENAVQTITFYFT
jgi:thiamine pyrophosphate-dependent acetolactate synthase large subunit-like protein